MVRGSWFVVKGMETTNFTEDTNGMRGGRGWKMRKQWRLESGEWMRLRQLRKCGEVDLKKL